MQGVIFDVDGTLVDSVDLHAKAWQDTFAHFGHPAPFDRVRSQIGKGGDQLMPLFIPGDELKQRGKQIEEFRTDLFKRKYLGGVRGFRGVRDLFQRLLGCGWQIALASSAKADELQIYKRLANIGDLLDAETSSDDAEKSKPHPDIFQAALARLKLSPSECLVVGDSPFDAEAANKAGIRAIGFRCGGFPESDLRAAGCEELFDNAEDVLARFESSVFSREAPHAVRK